MDIGYDRNRFGFNCSDEVTDAGFLFDLTDFGILVFFFCLFLKTFKFGFENFAVSGHFASGY